jgi:hypothetical protein
VLIFHLAEQETMSVPSNREEEEEEEDEETPQSPAESPSRAQRLVPKLLAVAFV